MKTSSSAMSVKERIFHSMLFEVGAILLSAFIALLFFRVTVGTAMTVGLAISALAMTWNFLFNWGFDKVFTAPRESRGFGVRLLHTLSFEGGLLIMTIPVVAYLLKIGLWQAFMLDIGMTVAIVIYTLIFNWIYDHARLRFIRH
ncbi:MAG: PACE efflux transporter [Moraxella sp.]|nr:PACE efflux transporter [Moraxella sp.]